MKMHNEGQNVRRINVRRITGLETLAGKSGATRDFPKFMNEVEASPEGSTVLLDWSDIEVATASYFTGTYIRLLRMTMTGDMDRYLILAGLNDTCLDELKLALELTGLVGLMTDCGKKEFIKNVRAFGKLEPAYVEALEAVQRTNGISASELYQQSARGKDRIGKTAWVNRLTNLHRLRLVRKQKSGRQFIFKPVNEGG